MGAPRAEPSGTVMIGQLEATLTADLAKPDILSR